MTSDTSGTLKSLQRMDREIDRVRTKVASYEPLLEQVEEPATELEASVENTHNRLQEMRVDERRLERSVDEKKERVRKLEERMNIVRTEREATAVQTELEMVRRALDGDEQEALSLLDHIRRMEERLAEQREELSQAQAELEPRRQELMTGKSDAEKELDTLLQGRDSFVSGVDASELRIYESIRGGGRSVIVADLTGDGACGACYSMVPLQVQAEIRHGNAMIRCEVCGVILTPVDESEEAVEAAAAEAEAIGDEEE